MVWKYLRRIVYGLVVAVGLMLTFSLTDSYTRSKALKAVAEPALINEDYDLFVPTKYYNKTPLTDSIVTVNEHKLRILVYEVSFLGEDINKNPVVRQGIAFMMHMLEGKTFGNYYGVKVKTVDDIEVEYLGRRYLDLPFYIAINDQTMTPIMDLELFNDEEGIYSPINRVEVYLEGMEEPYASVEVNYIIENFHVKEELEDYYNTNQVYPETSTGNISITEGKKIESSPWVLINMIIYIIISIALTIFIFTFKKKKLGRKEPTIGVKQDIKRLNRED